MGRVREGRHDILSNRTKRREKRPALREKLGVQLARRSLELAFERRQIVSRGCSRLIRVRTKLAQQHGAVLKAAKRHLRAPYDCRRRGGLADPQFPRDFQRIPKLLGRNADRVEPLRNVNGAGRFERAPERRDAPGDPARQHAWPVRLFA